MHFIKAKLLLLSVALVCGVLIVHAKNFYGVIA